MYHDRDPDAFYGRRRPWKGHVPLPSKNFVDDLSDRIARTVSAWEDSYYKDANIDRAVEIGVDAAVKWLQIEACKNQKDDV